MKNLHTKIIFLSISLLFSGYTNLFAQSNFIYIPDKSDKTRELLMYDGNEELIENKFKDNAFGRYGKYYSNLIPKNENIDEHLTVFNEIKTLYKKIQGCEYNNPAIFNGMSILDIKAKILEPAKKLADNKVIGENEDTLVIIVFNAATDRENAFKSNMATDGYSCKKCKLSTFDFNFDEAFLEHYDNILLVQPNDGQSADKTLDLFFTKLENCLADDARLDITFMGHGKGKEGVVLSFGSYNEERTMDLSDFKPLEKGGNIFAQSMKNIFIKSIENGYKPRIIGIGCSSEFMQTAIYNFMPEEYKYDVKVFGAPESSSGAYVLGFTKNYLQMILMITNAHNKLWLIIDISDGNFIKENNKDVESFMILPDKNNESSNMHIFSQYENDNIDSGWLTKPSGVSMQYIVREFNKAYPKR